MDTNEFIIAAFNVLLGRKPDKIGMEYWAKKFQEGITRDEFLSCLISSAEFHKNRPSWYYDPVKSKPSGLDISYLIERGLKIGNNCTVHFDTILDQSHCHLIEIGDNVTFAPRCHVLAHDGSMKTTLGFTKIGRVIIENNVFIGAGAIILPNVHIGNNSIIGAGSVVTHNVPEKSIVAGNPAKVLCSLDSFLEKHKEFAKCREDEEIIGGFGYKF
jgi:maltose O-acetyltransferase